MSDFDTATQELVNAVEWQSEAEQALVNARNGLGYAQERVRRALEAWRTAQHDAELAERLKGRLT